MLPPLYYFSDVIIDASMPNVVRDGGQMWNKADKLEEVGAMDIIFIIVNRSGVARAVLQTLLLFSS